MSQDLLTTVPYVYEALVETVKAACEEQEHPTSFFDFEPINFEPARYVCVTGILNHHFEWEAMGTFAQKEHYTIAGFATIYTGDNPGTNPNIATELLQASYTMFNTTVMTAVMTKRNAPVLGNTYPNEGAVYLVLPGETNFQAGPGVVDGEPSGWMTRLNFSFNFSALITPG